MLKKLFVIFSITIVLFIPTQSAEAHFLATDGNIGAVLHVDPNDDPVAGTQASFFFEFKDKTNKFKPQNCDCTFEIDENGKNIFSQPLFQNNSNPSLNNASVFYTFPQKDVYQVIIIGKPVTPNAFQSFILTWNFRVDQQAASQDQTQQQNRNNFFSTHFALFIVLCMVIIGFFIYFIFTRLPMRKIQTKKGGEEKDDKKNSDTIY